MNRKTIFPTPLTRAFQCGLASASLLVAGPLLAQDGAATVSFQFSQTGFADGGVVRGFVSGQDLDGNGQLYMMGSAGQDFLGFDAGDEVEFMSLTFENVNGRTVTQTYDRNVANAEDPINAFYGFSYNLDGGELGDDPDEGISFAPPAPSTSYFLGPLFAGFVNPVPLPDTQLVACGEPDGAVCSGIISLVPGEQAPDVEVTFVSLSGVPVPMTDELRFSFTQDGFPNGGRIHGTLTGRDLNGDGQLFSIPSGTVNFLGLDVEPSDEVTSATVTFENFDGGRTFTNVFDTSIAGIEDPSSLFMAFRYDLNGGPLGDDPNEGFTVGPFAPSTTYIVGEFLAPYINPVPFDDVSLTTCGDPDAGVCAGVISLVPGADPNQVDVTFSEFGSGMVAVSPDPARVDETYSGSWYDTERSGEGIVMHVLPDSRILVYWMTYDNDRNQRWFVGTGQVEGRRLVIDELFVTDGGLFGQTFDPNDVNLQVAGSLSIEFDSCNSGTLSYLVDEQEGSLNLTRLSAVSTLTCVP